jgi:tetratricopeptide (TPR) repeat protein
VADGYLLWTQTYHRRLATLAEFHKDWARAAIADFTQAYTGRASLPRTQYYAQARDSWTTYTREGLETSVTLFQKAIQADPSFAPAWAGLADANNRLSDFLGQPETRLAEARKAAAQAISLDPSNAEANGILGEIYLYKDWNFRGAARQLERTVLADPARISPSVHYSQVLTILGEMDAAAEAITAARASLPPVPELLFQEGSVMFLARRYEKMESVGRELIALDPASASGNWLVAVSLEQRGHVDQAVEEFRRGLERATKGDLRTLCGLSHAYGLKGDRPLAMEILPGNAKAGQKVTRFELPYCTAMTYTALRDHDKAFEWLDKARASKDPSFPFFPRDPRFDPLKRDPRYQPLVDSLRTSP